MTKSSRFFALFLLCALVNLSSGAAAEQEPMPPLPRKLTLAQAESLLIQRNLMVLAAKYQIEAGRAARLIASYRPNPVVTLGAEQFPFYSPLPGSAPRF